LVTNEGNARLVTTLPRVHVVIIGYEKLIPKITDAACILQIQGGLDKQAPHIKVKHIAQLLADKIKD